MSGIPEVIECRGCGNHFDLSAQSYYDNRCPDCIVEEEAEPTWPTCDICGDQVPVVRRVHGRFEEGEQLVRVCGKGCKLHAKQSPLSPLTLSIRKGSDRWGLTNE